ncbi:hypothetical protein BKA56DRAFT_517186 [Ilyonectria sp. MPI-CAGE-AT-0026]|nr:hypothetical protein BKA56DRAFT_517186 [Ilyonectria sp. MPI-CAGE-AT-0026]
MRLLNAKTLHFSKFDGDDIPEYAILSHRWECDELSYQDMCRAIQRGNMRPGMGHVQKKKGFLKVYNFTPQELEFFDQNWKKCGSASDLNEVIQAVTGIDVRGFARDIRQDRARLWTVRVARRMAWAANRQTTQIEDGAYSLLGLFNLNMPMLYGENEGAFQRLQEEIIKVDEDASILAWSCIDADAGFAPNGLARSAARFRKYLGLVERMLERNGTDSSFVRFNPTMTPRGLQATLKIRGDPNDQSLGYAVLTEGSGKYSTGSESLILPIIFSELPSSPSGVTKECIRFSDPLWVPSGFVKRARAYPVCFIRHVQAVDLNRNSNGFSLCSTVWKEYVTTFTYPVQTQPGRRHFPAVFGGFPRSSRRKMKGRTFILELAARAQASQRFAVLVDYQVKGGKIVKAPTVTVISLQRAMDLVDAVRLAKPKEFRPDVTHCALSDCNGNEISTDQIVRIRNFHDYWINAGDDDFDELSERPAKKLLVKALCTVRKRDMS